MALDDLTVLDLSHALAGPFATTLLADYGAEVIKIEAPDAGDMARAWGPPFYDDESAYFVNLHRNKKSVQIDLKHAEGRELFFRLLDTADIVIENLRIGTVAKLGLDYERCAARRPGIVYCSISGFGQNGPYRDRAALDLIVQAESGMISVTGPEGGPGVRCGVSIADITAGIFSALGIMMAVHSRERTGRGQFIDISMLEGQMSIMQSIFGAYLADGIVPKPWGTAYAALLPYQTFRTKTRELALGIGSDKLWRMFCPLIGLPEYAARSTLCDQCCACGQSRGAHRRTPAGISHAHVRGMGSHPADGRRSGRRHQHRRAGREPSAGGRARRAGAVRASRGWRGPRRRTADSVV